jgi:seryl-tRNA synthetase
LGYASIGGNMAKKKKIDVEEETISSIAEFSEETEEVEEELFLDEDAEEKLDEYLEGAPAIISSDLPPVEVSEDYPSNNHVYCRTKASKTHREITPEFNHTLIIREKK